MTATGQVTFRDVNRIHSHAFTVSSAAAHGSASVDASGNWTYTVSDSGAVDALAVGEHLADSFTVQVDDHHGGLATQEIGRASCRASEETAVSAAARSGKGLG